MDVTCPQCDTLFELEDTQFAPGTMLQCSECNHRFRIYTENTKRWMLRSRSSGDILYFNTFDVLYEWMMSQKVSKHDEISRTGKKWTTLESIGEFTPVFQVLDSIKDLLPKSPDQDPLLDLSAEIQRSQVAQAAKEKQRQKPQRPRIQTVPQYSNFATPTANMRPQQAHETTAQISFSTPTPEPKSETTSSLEIPLDMSSELYLSTHQTGSFSTPHRKTRTWLLAILVLLIVGSAAAFLLTMKRQTPVISLNEKPAKPANMKRDGVTQARTFIQSAQQAGAQLAEEKRQETLKIYVDEAQKPVYSSLEKARLRAKKKSEKANVEKMLEKGLKALENGNLAVARGAFIHVLDAQPKNSEAVTGLGWVKLEGGNAKGAAREFRRALKINPSYGEAYMGLGQALRESGKPQEALAAYTKYLRRYPRGSRSSIAKYQQTELRRRLGINKNANSN